MKAVKVSKGDSAIILAQPHSGTHLPKTIAENLNEVGRQLLDTDWHIPRLYDGLLPDATIVRANFSRYVIDPNRDPNGGDLYPGQNSTALVPRSTFDGKAIWKIEPSGHEIEQRCKRYHFAYHQALSAEIERLKSQHGTVLIYDCHSIRSKIPFLFDGRLADLNIGDNSGQSCAADITTAVENACQNSKSHSVVSNGRFRGGWTTRYYGRPQDNQHAIQMELAQRAYLQTESSPFAYDLNKAALLRSVLSDVLQELNRIIIQRSLGG